MQTIAPSLFFGSQPDHAQWPMKDDSLENHLKSWACLKPDYELLYSIWILNKKNLTQGLSIISAFFPHFSQHDFSHTLSLINNIECFLGETRINQLGATDTFLLLMGALVHDVGMILTHHIIEKKWKEEEFSSWLQQLVSGLDPDLAEAARTLLRHHRRKPDESASDDFSWALDVRHAVTIITAECFRRGHARQGTENILTNKQFCELTKNFHATQLPKRFMELLGKVASLHCEDFEQVMAQLARTANGYKQDFCHPRFIACMIRLGDLLDVDSGRFNDYALATLAKVPASSLLHKEKHAAVRHLLISPGAIEVELDCQDEHVYRLSRDWFDWLEEEVAHQNRAWTQIVPDKLDGLPPVIQRGGIRILYKGFQSPPELMNLRFEMPREKIFQMLQGGGIYKEPGLVFIREIVQNAMDASKIQMWTDIRNGGFCGKLKREDIQFPHDLQDIYPHYPVTLRVKWKDADRKVLQIECEDRGTGISEATLIRMTQRVGESHRKDPGYNALYKEMPYWLKPTAAFGVGLQSIFFVASSFEVETHYVGEESKRIIFRNSAQSQYCSLEKGDPELLRGTRVRVEIPREKIREIITSNPDTQKSLDLFADDEDAPYLAILDNFVDEMFSGIESLRFIYETINPNHCFERGGQQEKERWKPLGQSPNFLYSCKFEEGIPVFYIREKEIGSSLKLSFELHGNLSNDNQRLRIRDVIVANASLENELTQLICYDWNLNCQETDKMLDISRDNLTTKGKGYVEDALCQTLLPYILPRLNDIFLEKFLKKEQFGYLVLNSYLYYIISLRAFGLELPQYSLLKQIDMLTRWVSCGQGQVSAHDFIQARTLYFVRSLHHQYDLSNEKNRKHITDTLSKQIILWSDWALRAALNRDFICTDIVIDEQACLILTLERISQSDAKFVTLNDKRYLRTLERYSYQGYARYAIYALMDYDTLAVKRKGLADFCLFPSYAASGILSPFKSSQEIDELEKVVRGKSEDERRDIIRKKLGDYVPPRMVEAIRKHSVKPSVSIADIESAYIRLIEDFLNLPDDAQDLYFGYLF